MPEDSIFELSDFVCAKVDEDAATGNLFLDEECHYALILFEKRKPNEFTAYAKEIANADGTGCSSFLSFKAMHCTSLDGDEITSYSFDKDDVAKVIEPAKVDDLLAEARADGSFFELPEDCQLAAAAFCVAIGDDDRDIISGEDAGKLLKRWRHSSGRA